jgi:NADH-quinone oxidoreductase subunit G/[NiFe] hydrogenase diaphorase moiety small subunit
MADRPDRAEPRRKSGRRPDPGAEEAIGARVRVRVDGVDVRVPLGATILDAARLAGVRIPTLCHHPELGLAGLCRVCLVEVAGQPAFQAACAYPITSPIEVRTHTREIAAARRRVVELLLARHDGDCTTCVRNGDCELRRVAAQCGLDGPGPGRTPAARLPIDGSRPSLIRDPNRCVACRRCVRTCADLQFVGVFEAIGRGADARISTFADRPLAETDCIDCGQCLVRCPTAALRSTDSTPAVWAALDDPTRQVVISVPASVRAILGDERGTLPEALRRLGFAAVLDPGTAADVAVLEHVAELLDRLHRALVDRDPEARGPLFTSCCPAWVAWVRRFFPDSLPRLSRVRHPLFGLAALAPAMLASDRGIDPAAIATVAAVPCAALERQCLDGPDLPEGRGGTDLALTTRDLARMLADAGLDLGALPASECDRPFAAGTGSGALRDVTGGVVESVLRTLLEAVRGAPIERLFDNAEILPVRGFDGIRYAGFPLDRVGPAPVSAPSCRSFDDFDWLAGQTLRIGICHGTANARRVIEDIRAGGRFGDCHLIEVMACPGGCIGGGGHPLPAGPEALERRARALYAGDRSRALRKAHEHGAALEIFAASWYTPGP